MWTLVTGATGLLGNNILRQLLERGDSVRALVREGANPRPLAGLDVEVVRADLTDAESVRLSAHGAARIVHAAAHVAIGWRGERRYWDVNVSGTRHVVDAALANGSRLVYVSTADTLDIGAPDLPADENRPAERPIPCPYIVTKQAAEKLVLDEVALGNLDAVVVNPVYLIGPWDWRPSSGQMLLEVASGKALLAPPGGNEFCDARDAAAGAIAALDRGRTGRKYILGGESLSYLEAWRIFAQVAGRTPPRGVLPSGVVQAAGVAGDIWGRLSGQEPRVNSAAAKLSLQTRHLSHARAAAELGYRSRPLIEAATAAWEWFREFGYAPSAKVA